jgi:hypothetical protein
MGKRFRIIVYLLLAATSIAPGQEDDLVEFEFKVFGVGSDSYEGLFYYNDGEYLPLDFHRTHRSIKTYEYRGQAELLVYIENPDYQVSSPNSPKYYPISQIPITSESKRLLIVFSANRNNRSVADTGRRFNLYALNDDKNYFSRNTIIILNTTGAGLFGRVAQTNIKLPVGASKPIPYKDTGRGKSETKIALALETKEGARLVMSNDVRLSTNRRILLILEPPRRPGSFRISVRKLSESIFPVEEED